MGGQAGPDRRRLRHLPRALLGIIFLPFATLIYVLLYTPGRGVTGWDWFWVAIAALLDIGHWGAGGSQRRAMAR